ncbi:MAG: hypothetical protein INF81_08830 [Roseomonas sp.]|jgi:hypothetical protein|nr:hypothetical protein [Roseomonas sp.]MCA3429675.1 hypothetical protein [Roseomonas sp.]MCA3435671.1 hypothetical protein [Roseomonas sp.]MCZ8142778.1 hypothetical protein [Acetobacteraceae bacterium]MCZ8279125.1 hypothetical protein [Acetobacteraceae bacterium]
MPLPLLLMGLWAWRAKLALILLLLWVGGAAAILLWPRGHVARAQVAPAETTAFAISSLLSAHPLALGQGLDTRPGGNFAVYLAALRSPDAARMLTTETALLQAMERNRQDSPLWSLRVSLGLSRALDADDVLAWMERHVAVTQNLGSITWTLELTHADPALALQALISLHRFAEAKVRADLADQAARRVAALQARLQGESDVFLRNNLYDLLAQQQRAGLVVAADEAVAARLIAAPMVEARASRPNRPLLLGLWLLVVPLAVLMAAAGLLLMRRSFRDAALVTRSPAMQGD